MAEASFNAQFHAAPSAAGRRPAVRSPAPERRDGPLTALRCPPVLPGLVPQGE
jgi:hypothetical protein